MEVKISFAHYGELRDVNANDNEILLYEKIVKALPSDDFQLVRKSDQYLTLAFGVWDIVRFKWTDRAKWISLPITVGTKKLRLESMDDLENYKEELIASYEYAKKNM